MKTKSLYKTVIFVALATLLGACTSMQWSATRIDQEADDSLQVFQKQIKGSEIFLNQAAGYLVFPRVLRAGLVAGGETGEGVLRVSGKTVDYIRITSGSIGLQAGAQARSIVIAFMTTDSLQKFRDSSGWKVGVDGSVALVDIGAGKTIDTANIKDPVVGFVFGSKGLMYNLTLEGTKFTKMDKGK